MGPFFRGAGFSGRTLATGFSRPSIAVASRLLGLTNTGLANFSTMAAWIFSPSRISANSLKAREKTDSEGISHRLPYPQMRRNPGEVRKASRVEQVKGWL
jgi:hypothetical protein